MAVGWFVSNMKTKILGGLGTVGYIAMDDFTQQIRADGGDWRGIYVGNQTRALCKVSAAAATLATIAADPAHMRIPIAALDTTLSSLTNPQKTALQSQLTAMGYTAQEVTDAFPNIGGATLRQVLEFARQRRTTVRFDGTNFIADGPPETVEPLSYVDGVN